jgi:hypothetical protein
MNRSGRPLLALVLGALTSSWSASGQLFFYEAFDYAENSALPGQGGWSNASGGVGDDITIGADTLSVTGLPTLGGRSTVFGGAGKDPLRSFTESVTTVWYSFAVKVTELGALTADGGYFAGLRQSNTESDPVTRFGATLHLRPFDTGFNLGIRQRSSGTSPGEWDPTTLAVGDTVFVVGNYQFNPGADDDVANLWVNPAAASFGSGSAPSPSVTTTIHGTDLANVDRFFLRQDSATETPTSLILDELRVGTSWQAVTSAVPEPGAYGVVASLGIGLFAIWHRRRRARQACLLAPPSHPNHSIP